MRITDRKWPLDLPLLQHNRARFRSTRRLVCCCRGEFGILIRCPECTGEQLALDVEAVYG